MTREELQALVKDDEEDHSATITIMAITTTTMITRTIITIDHDHAEAKPKKKPASEKGKEGRFEFFVLARSAGEEGDPIAKRLGR